MMPYVWILKFRDADKKPEDATEVKELISMFDHQFGK